MEKIKEMWKEHPLALILASAIFFRLIAVLFAKGYGMHDDHFLVLEWAKNMMDGVRPERNNPAGHSLVYPGLHYLVLILFKKLNLYNPDFLMYIFRFLHAALSMITVYYGYKIVLFRYGKKLAAEAGLLMAILWIFPFMSVRNLIEMVCVPFTMIAAYNMIKYEDQKKLLLPLLTGLFLGIAFTFRYQTNLFMIGFVFFLLFRKDFPAIALLSSGFFVSSFLVQGLTDWIVYGYPYASFIHYFFDNSSNAYNYTTAPWYIYIFTIMGILIPPTSLLIMFGFLRQWKKLSVLFWPTLIFLVFHSIFPNKQERFILPAIPLFIIIGIVGWREFVFNSTFWSKHNKIHDALWKWFWVVNTILLLIASTTYSKRARVEVMKYFYGRNDVTAIFLETSDVGVPNLPTFYMDNEVPMYMMTRYTEVDSIKSVLEKGIKPNYLVMMNNKRMEERFERLDQLFPQREKMAVIDPSLADQLLYILNPRHNINQQCIIYKIK